MISEEKKPINSTLSSVDKSDEVDLLAILKTIWKGRKIILICLSIGLIFGIFVAILTPKTYTVATIMVPQVSSGNKSQLSSLASLAGIDMGMSQTSELSPLIYPKIVNSVPFKLELMNTPLHFEKIHKPVSVFEYFTTYNKLNTLGLLKKYTLGLPGVIVSCFSKNSIAKQPNDGIGNGLIQLTKQQNNVKKYLDGVIVLQVDKKEGYLTLVVSMPEALAAAELAKKAQDLLQRDITRFKVEKSQANLDFIEERYNIAKAEAEKYQINIAVNTDRYKDLTSSVPQVSGNRLQTKYTIANSVYLDLAKQLEQAKIQVKKDTPLFTIVEPVTIPSEKSNPNRPMIITIWVIFCGIIGISIVFGKQYFHGHKN